MPKSAPCSTLISKLQKRILLFLYTAVHARLQVLYLLFGLNISAFLSLSIAWNIILPWEGHPLLRERGGNEVKHTKLHELPYIEIRDY